MADLQELVVGQDALGSQRFAQRNDAMRAGRGDRHDEGSEIAIVHPSRIAHAGIGRESAFGLGVKQ